MCLGRWGAPPGRGPLPEEGGCRGGCGVGWSSQWGGRGPVPLPVLKCVLVVPEAFPRRAEVRKDRTGATEGGQSMSSMGSLFPLQ